MPLRASPGRGRSMTRSRSAAVSEAIDLDDPVVLLDGFLGVRGIPLQHRAIADALDHQLAVLYAMRQRDATSAQAVVREALLVELDPENARPLLLRRPLRRLRRRLRMACQLANCRRGLRSIVARGTVRCFVVRRGGLRRLGFRNFGVRIQLLLLHLALFLLGGLLLPLLRPTFPLLPMLPSFVPLLPPFLISVARIASGFILPVAESRGVNPRGNDLVNGGS
mmetsp:Transcript_167026/g.536302  ORF Transcript_167026/g.536302 Transcript_167026/m.536302 type:complete len:223 (-) Transcript_167026:161-829(-)